MSVTATLARVRGFTLIELMVTVVLLGVLAALAAPSMNTWIANSQVRSTADALQNGLRTAQTEALRRSRQTVFSLTNSASPRDSLTAVANGRYWSINVVAREDETYNVANSFVEAGVLGSSGASVQIAGPKSICFNSVGRVVVNLSPGVAGAECTAPATAARPEYGYDVTRTGADRRLRVTVAVGGQVRMCDPGKTLSAADPDGCPAVAATLTTTPTTSSTP